MSDPGVPMPDSEADWEAYHQIGEDWEAEEEAQTEADCSPTNESETSDA